MNNEFKQAIEQVIWQVLEKHYNVDRSEPRVLTYKHIMVQDPIGDLASQVANITEELIRQAIEQLSAPPPPPEEEEDEGTDMYFGSHWEYGGD